MQAFFRAIDDDKFHLIFSYQAQLGLRIGEVCKLHLSGINFQTRELTLKTEKAKVVDSLIIPMPLFTETVNFIRLHESQIEQAGGYLFFKDSNSIRKERFIGPNYVRGMFRRYVVKAGLDFTYDISDESSPDRATRSLHRLTTHSLRHYAITRFAKQTNGNLVLTCRFARHSDPSTAMTYINTDRQELYDQIGGTFGVSQALGIRVNCRHIIQQHIERCGHKNCAPERATPAVHGRFSCVYQ